MTDVAYRRQTASPFDALRHLDDQGEHWLAREICEPLTYTWRGFTDAIKRARTALTVNMQDPDIHIQEWKRPSIGFGAGKTQTDYRLTREGVYAIIQGGDPQKPEIAAGWAYFRSKTRQAEVMLAGPPSLDPDLARIYELTIGMQQTRERQRALEAEQQRMAGELQDVAQDVADLKALSPMASNALLSLRDAARAVTDTDMGQNTFKRWLMAHRIMFTDHQGHDRIHQDLVKANLGIERWEEWQNGRGHAWVPYFTPVGVARLRRIYMEQQDKTAVAA